MIVASMPGLKTVISGLTTLALIYIVGAQPAITQSQTVMHTQTNLASMHMTLGTMEGTIKYTIITS